MGSGEPATAERDGPDLGPGALAILDPGERAERDIALSIIEGQAFCNGNSDERLAAIEPVRVTLLAAP